MKCLNCEISVSGWRLGGMEVGLKLTRMEQTFYLPRYCPAATRCSAILKKKQDYKGNKKLCVKAERQMARQFLGKKSNYSKYFIALLLKEQDRRGHGRGLNVFQRWGIFKW